MRSSSPTTEIVLGALLTIGVNGGLAVALILVGLVGTSIYEPLASIIFAAPFIGLIQLLYVVPICFRLRNRRQWNWMKGVIIGACITALLNGGCWFFLGASGGLGSS